jgi:hypothetical protein
MAINVLPPSSTEVRDQLAEDHRHARRGKRNKASLRDIEAKTHQPGWRFCGFCEKLRRGRHYYRNDSVRDVSNVQEGSDTFSNAQAVLGHAQRRSNVRLLEQSSKNARAMLETSLAGSDTAWDAVEGVA